MSKSRVPGYPSHRGASTTRVAIVGGGLTGCATAYAFAAAGIDVILLEAERLGSGRTAHSFGWVSDTPDPAFQATSRAAGLRDARRAWQAWRRAALDFAALVRRLDLRCHLEAGSAVHLARTPPEILTLKKDAQARREAGLDTAVVTGTAARALTGIETMGALRTKDSATLDPYRAVLGLAGAAAARGAAIFERSPVRKTKFSASGVDVETARGTVRAERVVIATGRPGALSPALARHVRTRSTFLAMTEPIPGRLRRLLGEPSIVTTDSAVPAHAIRWVGGERLLVAGADADAVPARLREKTVVQRTGQLMYELSTLYPDISGIAPAFGWEAPYGSTADGLPFIGPHRNFPRHLFAFGSSPHRVTDAYLASRVLLRHHLGEPDPADAAFGFTSGRL
ncbi:MAG: NAD(P)/FAD-dependent oxidoreductase [Vicinamibacterales bacterium]